MKTQNRPLSFQQEVLLIMVIKKLVNLRIKPYIQEDSLQIIWDIVIITIVLLVLCFANFPLMICLAFVLGYSIIVLVFYYRVVIEALIDRKKEDYVTELVEIKKFVDEFSLAEDRFGRSNIRFLYPAEMNIGRYKIHTVTNYGEEKKLRSIMSFRRTVKFMLLEHQKIEYLQVTYLKRSKILIQVNLPQEPDNKMSRKQQIIIDKSISFINMSI